MHTLCTPLEGAPAPSCEHAMRLYTMSAASGMAAKDFGGVYQFLAKRAEDAGNRFGRDGAPKTVRRQFRAGDKEGDGRPRTSEGPEQRAYRLSRGPDGRPRGEGAEDGHLLSPLMSRGECP